MVFTLCVFTHTILQSLLKGSDGFFKTMLWMLQIIVDGNCDLAVRQVASIHFNNFVSKNWSPLDLVEQSKIIPGDKDLIRQNILVFVVLVPPLLRVQLGDVLCILIGGIGPAGHSTDDLYVLDMTNDKFKWHRVVVQGEGPGPRYGHVRVLISDGLQAEVFGFVASSASSLNMSSRSSLSHYLFFQAFFEGKLRCKGVQATSILVLVNSASLSHEIHIRRTKY